MVARFAGGLGTVMTGRAAAWRHAGVVEPGAGESCVACVAGITGCRGGDVGRMFAQGIPLSIGTVVAGRALAGDDALGGGVTERRSRERASGRVAGVAGLSRRNVVRRFKGGGGPPLDMASGAATRNDAGVIEPGAGERRVTRVASVAGGRSGNVGRMFAQCVPLGVGAIVAGGALTGDDALGSGVCEGRSREAASRRVAGIAGQCRRDMVRRFESGGGPSLAMAGGTAARRHAGVIKGGTGHGK